jgi:osmotically-inducible protein OsmY
VRPEPIPGNEKIKNKIIASFSKDPFIDRFAISVEVIAGFVTLSGKVNTSFEKERAETIAARTDGVIDVINNIEYMYKWTWKPDWEIKADVREQLHWDVMLTDKDIAVDVGHGVVTLTGTVDTWIEWHAAEENAYAGGAKDVINDLLIRYD